MAKLSAIREPVKAIIAAESGSGKSGALWSLAQAGFNVRIYDADRGTAILQSVLKDFPEAMDRVEVQSFTNQIKSDADGWGAPVGVPKAWTGFLKALNQWPDAPKGEGPLTWDSTYIMAVDSLTLFGRHALLNAQYIEGKSRWRPELQHYGVAMAQIEALFAMLYGDDIRCHVLYMTHVKDEFNSDGEVVGAFPSSLGQSLKNVIPRYVNDILTIRVTGQGPQAKRYLSTKPTVNRILTKTSDLKLKDEYLLTEGRIPKPGLAEYFADRGWPSPLKQGISR